MILESNLSHQFDHNKFQNNYFKKDGQKSRTWIWILKCCPTSFIKYHVNIWMDYYGYQVIPYFSSLTQKSYSHLLPFGSLHLSPSSIFWIYALVVCSNRLVLTKWVRDPYPSLSTSIKTPQEGHFRTPSTYFISRIFKWCQIVTT